MCSTDGRQVDGAMGRLQFQAHSFNAARANASPSNNREELLERQWTGGLDWFWFGGMMMRVI